MNLKFTKIWCLGFLALAFSLSTMAAELPNDLGEAEQVLSEDLAACEAQETSLESCIQQSFARFESQAAVVSAAIPPYYCDQSMRYEQHVRFDICYQKIQGTWRFHSSRSDDDWNTNGL